MPLFQQTLKQKFTPKTAKLSDVYKTSTGKKIFGTSVHQQAVKAMQKAGFNEDKIRKTVYKDQDLTVKEMKEVAIALNKAGVYGFTKSPKTVVEKYLNKERVKRQSIAGIRKEHILEAGEEDINSYGATSLNQKGSNQSSTNNSSKKPIATSSINQKGKSEQISSFGAKKKAISSLRGFNNIGSSLGGGGGSTSFKPKF